MKIKKIFIRNLNSLAGDHLLDFSKKPLATCSLFAITGPTGSGKSTILDAICLALYNAAPRLNQNITSVTLSKSGALISKGASEAMVSVEYTQGRELYKSQWSIAYNRNNNLNERKQELSTFDPYKNDWILLETNTKVPAANTQITSLDFIQFTRSVLLAQGQFSALLNANKDERYNLMEKITGDDIYRKVGKKVYEKYSSLKIKLEEDEKGLKNFRLLSEAELYDYANQLNTFETELNYLHEEKNKKTTLKSIKEQIDIKRSSLAKVNLDLLKWEQDNTAFQPNKERLERYDNYHPLLNERDSLKEKITTIQSIENKMIESQHSLHNKEKQLSDKLTHWSALLRISLTKENFIGQFSQQLEAIQEAIEDKHNKNSAYHTALVEKDRAAENYLKIEKDKKDFAASILQIKEKKEAVGLKLEAFKEDIPLFEKLAVGQQFFQSLVNDRNSLFQQLGIALQIKLEDARDIIEKEERFLFLQLEAIRKLGRREDIEKHYDELQALESQLQQVLLQLENIISLEQESIGLLQEITNIDGSLPALMNERKKLEEEIQQHRDALAEIEKILALAAKEKDLAVLREHLVDGEPCPLCGSVHHPGNAGKSDQVMASKQAWHLSSLKSAEEKKEEMTGKIAAYTAKKDQITNRIPEIEQRVYRLTNEPLLEKFLNSHGTHVQTYEYLVQRLNETVEKKRQYQDVKTELSQWDNLRTKWQGEKDKLNQFDELARKKAELLTFFNDNLNVTQFNDIKPFLQNLSKKQSDYKDLEDALRNLEKDLDIQSTLLESTGISLENGKLELDRRIDAEKEALLSLQVAKQVLDELPTIDNPKAYLRDEPIAIQQLLSDISSFSNQIVENHKEASALRTSFSNQKEHFLIHLQKAGFSSEEALEDIRLSTEERNEFRHKKETLAQQKTSLDTNKKTIGDELQILYQQDDPKVALQQVIDDVSILEEGISQQFNQKGRIEQIMETDRESRKKYEKELLSIEEKKKEIRPFELLNSIIGDAQGKRFNEYAQELTLKRLIQATNNNLALINSRYLLDMHQDGEDMNHLYVIDQYMGNNRRAAKLTLSGGESFLVSLSMALGLSDMALGKAELGNLFIDEGFGSLDSVTLESAIAMLEEIQYQRGRSIGIISHVSELKDRISTQIRVIPTLGGQSKIDCVSS
jgi:exonuclease SbcC